MPVETNTKSVRDRDLLTILTADGKHIPVFVLGDGEGDVIGVDGRSNSLRTISRTHASTHDGDAYDFSKRLAVATGTFAYLLGKVGTNEVHFQDFFVKSDASPVSIDFFEAPTITADGTPETTHDRNRSTASTPTFSVFSAPTVSADGSNLFVNDIYSTSGQNKAGSESEIPGEWVLAPNTDYLIKIGFTGSGTANMVAGFWWYENTPA